MKIFLIFALTLFSISSLAYNDSRCNRVFGRYFWGASGLVSTSQFSSSTGECAAFGMNEEARQQYYALNFDQIKSDAARGEGDWMKTLLS